ncbi:hypothetical protein H7U37_09405 [Pseudoflavonifractor phocaeensis]|uniref:hypothetical protein n=1 Tax=Pseudoflavonifractor phocaeensis TaxID=1870988 RepID=UPI0019585E37|nr:hypothetical protein [Pseudoflavonifractor phocaeensis]MBM6938739.1 hypothetical protein [Pseudoflavonifractor phocaeensis]
MAHKILSAKLCQLDVSVDRLHRRIQDSQTAGHDALRREIAALEQECADAETALRENLRRSKSNLVSILAQVYGQVEYDIARAGQRLRAAVDRSGDPETAVEEELLLAEYLLDFAHQAADRVLLFSMKAIDDQLLQQEKGESL